MKANVCDFCIVLDNKIVIAKYSGSTAMKGNRITMCKAHNKNWKAIASDQKKVMDFLIDVHGKANELGV